MISLTPAAHAFLTLALLLIGLQFKHFLADFPIQANWQYLLKKSQNEGWALPLAIHAASHGVLTWLVCVWVVGWAAVWMALFDFVAHLCIDYWKAHLTHYTIDQKGFWVTLGVDQMLHHYTYIAIAFICVHPAFL